jgi:plasmid stabilization system protein ParE
VATIDTLVARFKWLTVNRSLCQPRDDLRPGLYGRFKGAHLIVFREGGDHVQIVRILHRHMDPARHPEG